MLPQRCRGIDRERGSSLQLSECDQRCATLFTPRMDPLGVGDSFWRWVCFAKGVVCLRNPPLSETCDHVADDFGGEWFANEELGLADARKWPLPSHEDDLLPGIGALDDTD